MHEVRISCNKEGKTSESWTGVWDLLKKEDDKAELLIQGRGSEFFVILGKYTYGNYLCIPSVRVGCGLAALNDTFWNYEQLSQLINETDAMTIAHAIRDFATKECL